MNFTLKLNLLALIIIASFPTDARANPPSNWIGGAWTSDNISLNGKYELNESIAVRGSIANDSTHAAVTSTIPIEPLNTNIYIGAGIGGDYEEYVRKDGDQLELLNRWEVLPVWIAGIETRVMTDSVLFAEFSGSDRAQGRVGFALEFQTAKF